MKRCPKCATQNQQDSKFCKGCGTSLEDVVEVSTNLSATASSFLNRAGAFLTDSAKKIENSKKSDQDADGIIPNHKENSQEMKPPASQKKNLQFIIVLGSILFVFILVAILGSHKSNKLIGMWKMRPNEMPGYGISMEIDKDTIEAIGDYVNYGGVMKFKYKCVSDSELILTYDWSFSEWPWDVTYVDEIPIKYSISEDGDTLELIWSGTSFVFLDNTYNTDYFNKNGAVMNGGMVTFKRVK